jgi:hypothetical protein
VALGVGWEWGGFGIIPLVGVVFFRSGDEGLTIRRGWGLKLNNNLQSYICTSNFFEKIK